MKRSEFSILKRLKSFGYALNGLKILFREEHNARIHLVTALFVIAAAVYFELNRNEWIAVVFSIGLVFTAEIMNTAIENIANFLTADRNDRIKRIKDLSAAAVLFSALTALAIGLIVFLPKIFS